MAALPVWQNDDARAKAPDRIGHLQPVLERVFDVAIGQIERLAMCHAKDLRGCNRLRLSLHGRSARAGLTACEVDDPRAPAARLHGHQCSAAGLFHVVPVRRYGKNVTVVDALGTAVCPGVIS